MNKRIIYPLFSALVFSILILAFLQFNGTLSQSYPISIEEAYPNLSFSQPVDLQSDNSESNLIYIVEQTGKIYSFVNSPSTNNKELFLDISSKVLSGGERGLLGVSFHPKYSSNGLFYVDYTAKPDGRTIISEFKSENNSVSLSTERIIFEQIQPFSNHNAGQIFFGLDGYLYITLGDGGSGGDPYNNAQNLSTYLGSILRIDIDHTSNGKNYSIPIDNPFTNNNLGYKEEIFAYGLRNPWRVSQDPISGTILAGDVGQSSYEEIDIIEKGNNYGWNIMEGFSCFSPSVDCNQTSFTLPIFDYGRNNGYAVTGGYVYRGAIQSLNGKYIFGDYGTGKIWEIDEFKKTNLLLNSGLKISSFGTDQNNELYFFDYSSGKIYQFVQSDSTSSSVSNITDTTTSKNTIPGFSLSIISSTLFLLKKKKY